MSTHNICFCEVIRKISGNSSICSYGLLIRIYTFCMQCKPHFHLIWPVQYICIPPDKRSSK